MAQRTFTVVTTLQDPLTAERLVDALQEAKVEAFTRVGGAASSAAFASAQPAFYDLLVATEHLPQAEALVRDFQQQLDQEAEANGRAAEEESLSGESPVQ